MNLRGGFPAGVAMTSALMLVASLVAIEAHSAAARSSGSFSRGGVAAGGGLSSGASGASRQASQGQRQSAQSASQGSRQDAMGERQSSRQDTGTERQSSRQDAAAGRQDSRQDAAQSGDYHYNNWDSGDAAAGFVAGAIVGGAAAAAATSAPATVVAVPAGPVGPPCNVAPVAVSGVPYYRCGSTWYTEGYGSAGVVYMPVPPPPGY
jgi:hypothetical protein